MVLFCSFLALAFGISRAVAQGPGRPGGPGPGQHGFGGRPGAQPPSGPWPGKGLTAGSPPYTWLFEFPLPMGTPATPEFSETIDGRTIEFYSITIEPCEAQIYPNLGPAHLTGYNGIVPGPTFKVQRGTETIIRYLNKGSVSSAVHLHGSYTHAAWDGWADDEMEVGEWKDYYYPNSENARSIWYHDHADQHTSSNAYYGQTGLYIIYDPAEDSLGLPSGDYDVPLAIIDKSYQSNGDLQSPEASTINYFGDIIHVNGQPWPYFAVEPRKYRFRIFNKSLSRPYDLYLPDADGNLIAFQVIASDSGLFESPVTTSDVVIGMGERYEIVVDFASYTGQNLTFMNGMEIEHVNEFENTNKIMMFVVGSSVSDSSNNGDVPAILNGELVRLPPRTTVDHVFQFQQGGEAQWTINGIDFDDVNNRVLARPPQGTVELWQVVHAGGPAVHPVHVHLVNFQVVSRTGGSRSVMPYEAAGLKDVVLLEPGETAEILAFYGPWNGLYMFHCHNLIHEDHAMMAAFNVTMLEALGYEFNSTISFSDPTDSRFAPQAYNAAAFEPDAISSRVASLASLNPYGPASSLVAAEAAYYATAGYDGDGNAATATAAAASAGRIGDYVWHGMGGTTSTVTPSTVPSSTAAPSTAPPSTATPATSPTTSPPTAQQSTPPNQGPPSQQYGPPHKRRSQRA